MNNFWNERFSTKEYVYGEEPNQFFKQELEKLKLGRILLPGEGEGRNAVFAAKIGCKVVAFDSSLEGKNKAEKLAKKNKVSIEYQIKNYEDFVGETEFFDCIALIYTHMLPHNRSEYHKKLTSFLKPGGILILEGFSKEQINQNTGGPRNVDMLFSKEELQNDFESFTNLTIAEFDVILEEGQTHQGASSVIRVLGIK